MNPEAQTQLHIRSYRSEDQTAVLELWRRCDLIRPWNDPRKDIARKLRTQPELFLVGETDGEVVATAMAGYDGHRGLVYYVAVSPERRRGGFGRAIMEAAEERLRALGCPKILLMVRRENERVIEFYDRLGYAPDTPVLLSKRLEHDELSP